MSGYFLGVDGGGTKTEFVCIDTAGAVVAQAMTGTTYHAQVKLAEARQRLAQGVDAVCGELAITSAALDYVFFGLPAYGEDATADPQLDAICGEVLGHDRYVCGNDMICGWAGSLGGEDGINIVAGTGSIGYGEYEGRAARVGGWGHVFGDEGSAYWIANRGLALFSRMSDGRAACGPLYRGITEALSLQHDLELCERVLGAGAMARSELAGLAGVVSAAAAGGDTQAAAILASAGVELFALARALRDALAFPADVAVPISWSGSVLTKSPLVRDSFVAQLADAGGFAPVEPRHAPGYGAALYARRQATNRS